MTQVLIAGNPNAGKTTLFNRLAGTKARTGNYPGVTVERRRAALEDGVELVDIPGTYSLTARSPEEAVAVEALLGEGDPKALVVVDATTLERGLYLVMQVLEAGLPAVVALNMMDEARERGIAIDHAALGEALGVEVVPIVASTGEGTGELLAAVKRAESAEWTTDFGDAEETVTRLAKERGRAWAAWALLSFGDDDTLDVDEDGRAAVEAARRSLEDAGIDVDVTIIGARYAAADALCAKHVKAAKTSSRGETLDRYLTHPVWGLAVFSLVMFVIFQSLFAWSDPFIGLVEDGIVWLQDSVRALMPAGVFTDLLAEGVVGGVGNVVVFVPQIAFLFLLVAFLEDSGYLARVAFVIDRLMSSVGLHGKAFVPLLSGFACAIPSVMSTRTIANRKDRLVTMLALPLMSCSARLPVYVLVTATVFVGSAKVFGFLSLGAVVLFSMYALSVVATLAAAAVMRRTVLKGPKPALVLELPPYRRPLLSNLLSTVWRRVREFLVGAGTVILALTIVLWALLSFPKSDAIATEAEAARAAATSDAEIAAIDNTEAADQLAYSMGGRLGHAIEPVIEPLGMDWRIGVGVIGAFAAREVFVSTLAMVFGIGDADEESEPLRESLQNATRADGTPVMTPLSGVALMVFFVLACQCISTVAVVKRESGGYRWPLFMVTYMTVLAYVAALLVFQVGTFLGIGTGGIAPG
ncbi:MAG: ferrous iron transport protein B [Myxococcota bacterium]